LSDWLVVFSCGAHRNQAFPAAEAGGGFAFTADGTVSFVVRTGSLYAAGDNPWALTNLRTRMREPSGRKYPHGWRFLSADDDL